MNLATSIMEGALTTVPMMILVWFNVPVSMGINYQSTESSVRVGISLDILILCENEQRI